MCRWQRSRRPVCGIGRPGVRRRLVRARTRRPAPIDYSLGAIGPNACILGTGHTCGGTLTDCASFHREAFGEDNPPSCEIDVIRGDDRNVKSVTIDIEIVDGIGASLAGSISVTVSEPTKSPMPNHNPI